MLNCKSYRYFSMAFAVMASLLVLFCTGVVRAADALVVHEWGTFTALQDEKGDALPGINVDDEPLPPFCHNISQSIIERPVALPRIMMKGVPERHPYVTLRLETPVLYFHPAATEKLPFSIDVGVRFHGGWVTEFYPRGVPDAPGMKRDDFHFGAITPATIGTLYWHNVQVGTGGKLPETTRQVWVAPREVDAATITVNPNNSEDPERESEKFLFYRGVGNRTVPLRVNCDQANSRLAIHGQCSDVLAAGQSAKINSLWLVHIRKDGSVAWKTVEPLTVTADRAAVLATVGSTFTETEYSAANFENIRKSMHKALVAEGLFDDEATAMLETWKHAYFQSPGLRLFFLVPRVWTDAVLPLKLSREARIERVMMGRLELISPEQRTLLKKLATMKLGDVQWVGRIRMSPNAEKFYQGRSDFGDLGVAIPEDYQTYLDLGRFRNALVLAEEKARPTVDLNSFINAYELYSFETQ